jgi:hypothetical protein
VMERTEWVRGSVPAPQLSASDTQPYIRQVIFVSELPSVLSAAMELVSVALFIYLLFLERFFFLNLNSVQRQII